MKTQGSFINLIWALIAKIKEVTRAPIVHIHPGAEVVAGLFLVPVICRNTMRGQAEEACLSERVFRYSSSQPFASSFPVSRVLR
jgi:hypothetical protein